jgi:hypothetical protein
MAKINTKHKKHLKGFARQLIAAFLLINLSLTVYGFYTQFTEPEKHVAFASPDNLGSTEERTKTSPTLTSPQPSNSPLGTLNTVGGQTGLQGFYFTGGQHPDAPPDYEYPGVDIAGSTAYFLMDFFKYLMSGIAIIMIVVIAIKLVVGGSSEETATKAKKGLGVAIVGLILIQLADVIVKKIFFGDQGQVLEDLTSAKEFASEGTSQIRGIVGFVEILLGAIAVLVIIINGIRIMVSGGEEEGRKKAIKNIGYAAGGLVLVGLSELIVKGFIFPNQGSELPSIGVGKSIFVMITNFISGFIAVIAFVMLLYAGYLYVVAGSEENSKEKVKKLITGAVIGLVVALGAYAITNTLIKFEEPNEYKASETLPSTTGSTQP